jgi:Zn-dependent protease with chaperone function
MSKYIQFLLVIVYTFITYNAVYTLVSLLSDSAVRISEFLFLALYLLWLIVCLTSTYWFTDIHLFFTRVRKPILEEELLLNNCLAIVKSNTNDTINYKLLINENAGIEAYAIGNKTIVISADSLHLLNEEQLCALLAHEMGHIRSNDTKATMAFYFARLLPTKISRIFAVAYFLLMTYINNIRKGIDILGIIALVIAGLLLLEKTKLFTYIVIPAFFIAFIWAFDRFFQFFWLLTGRYKEYRQDKFAHTAGFGMELREVLLKIAAASNHTYDKYSILVKSTHPLLHNRARRLEKLSGLRK